MQKRTLLVTRRVIVPEEHGLGSVTIGVHLFVVGVGMVRPVLFHPQPLASSDEIGSESKSIVDPRFFGCGSVVAVVLNIQTDQRLGDTVNDGKCVGGNTGDPVVLESEKETNVKECTGKVSRGSELASTSNNLEDFLLDLTFEWGVPDVSEKKKKQRLTVLASYWNSS